MNFKKYQTLKEAIEKLVYESDVHTEIDLDRVSRYYSYIPLSDFIDEILKT